MGKIKRHLEKYKVYYIGGVCLVVGVGAGALLTKGYMSNKIVVDSYNVSINSPKTNIIQTTLARRGHPGNMVKCLETGEIFASQGRAADANDIARSTLSKHLNGLIPHANELHFEKLGEMQ